MNCAQGGQQGGSDRGHRGYTSVQGTAGTPNPLPIPAILQIPQGGASLPAPRGGEIQLARSLGCIRVDGLTLVGALVNLTSAAGGADHE